MDFTDLLPRSTLHNHGYPGSLVVVDGSDGTGKTTLLDTLERQLAGTGVEVVRTRQPTTEARGTAAFSDFIFKPEERDDIDYRALLCLMIGDRLQHLHRVVRPALARGAVVLCDRYIFTQMVTTVTRGFRDEPWMLCLYPRVMKPDVGIVTDAPLDLVVSRIASRPDAREAFYERSHVESNLLAFRSVASLYDLAVFDTSASGPDELATTALAMLASRFRGVG
jgi:dTMP kinase